MPVAPSSEHDIAVIYRNKINTVPSEARQTNIHFHRGLPNNRFPVQQSVNFKITILTSIRQSA